MSAYSCTIVQGVDVFVNCVVYIKVQHSPTLLVYNGGGGGGGGGGEKEREEGRGKRGRRKRGSRRKRVRVTYERMFLAIKTNLPVRCKQNFKLQPADLSNTFVVICHICNSWHKCL